MPWDVRRHDFIKLVLLFFGSLLKMSTCRGSGRDSVWLRSIIPISHRRAGPAAPVDFSNLLLTSAALRHCLPSWCLPRAVIYVYSNRATSRDRMNRSRKLEDLWILVSPIMLQLHRRCTSMQDTRCHAPRAAQSSCRRNLGCSFSWLLCGKPGVRSHA